MSIFDIANEALSAAADSCMGECFQITPMAPARLGGGDQADLSRPTLTVNGIFYRSILTTAGRQSVMESRVRENHAPMGPDFAPGFTGATVIASVDACEFMVDGQLALLPKKPDRLQRVDHPEDPNTYSITAVEDDGGGRYQLHLVQVSE